MTSPPPPRGTPEEEFWFFLDGGFRVGLCRRCGVGMVYTWRGWRHTDKSGRDERQCRPRRWRRAGVLSLPTRGDAAGPPVYDAISVPKAALQRLLAETRGPVAMGTISASTAWQALAETCGMTAPLPSYCVICGKGVERVSTRWKHLDPHVEIIGDHDAVPT